MRRLEQGLPNDEVARELEVNANVLHRLVTTDSNRRAQSLSEPGAKHDPDRDRTTLAR